MATGINRAIPARRFIGAGQTGTTSPDEIVNLQHWFRSESSVVTDASAEFQNATNSELPAVDPTVFDIEPGVATGNTGLNANSLSNTDNALGYGDEDFYCSCWVRHDNVTQAFFNRGTSVVTSSLLDWTIFVTTGGTYYFRVSNGASLGQAILAAGYTLHKWRFIECYHDSVNNEIGIALDGGAYTTTSYSLGVQNQAGTNNFLCGNAQGTQRLDGEMESFGVFNTVPDSTLRAALFNGGAGVKYADLTTGQKTDLDTWYDMTEASGTRFDSEGSADMTENGTMTQLPGHVGQESFSMWGWVYLDSLRAANHIVTRWDFRPFILEIEEFGFTSGENLPISTPLRMVIIRFLYLGFTQSFTVFAKS